MKDYQKKMTDQTPFHRFNYASCKDMSTLDYTNYPMIDAAFASNMTAIIPSGRQYLIKFSKNTELKFPIPATPQFMDMSGLQFR